MHLTDEGLEPGVIQKGVYLQIITMFVTGAVVGAACVSLGFLIGLRERSSRLASLEEPVPQRAVRRPPRSQAAPPDPANEGPAPGATPVDAGVATAAQLQPPSPVQSAPPPGAAPVVTPQTALGVPNNPGLQAHQPLAPPAVAGPRPANGVTPLPVPARLQPSQQAQAQALPETSLAVTPPAPARQVNARTLDVRHAGANQLPATRAIPADASSTTMPGQARLKSPRRARELAPAEATLVGPHGTLSELRGFGQRPVNIPAAINQAGRSAMGVTVEVGSTRAADEAARLANVLKNLGYPVSVTHPQGGGGRDKSFHVQVGPYASRDGAEKVAQRLAMEGFKPSVPNTPVPIPDLASSPFPVLKQPTGTTQPAYAPESGPETVFVAQVAADGDRQQVLQRVEALKAGGYPAFLSTPQEARLGDRLFRALVGPFPSRADAEAAQRRLEGQGIKPFVRRWRPSASQQR